MEIYDRRLKKDAELETKKKQFLETYRDEQLVFDSEIKDNLENVEKLVNLRNPKKFEE